jgi:DNA-binding MarR family transcriptional regulator/GNAT superfamily N-acetyltransferase
MDPSPRDPRIAAIRRFNRFYTTAIGVLHEGLVGGPYSLTETRVMFEIGHRDGTTATALARDLNLDTGYLSRILARFARERLLLRTRAPGDARSTILRLTAEGQATLAPLEARSDELVAGLIARLPAATADEVVAAMARIETALSPAPPGPVTLRPPRPGELGWVIARHGAIYAQEFGWDATFETLVAGIAAGIMQHFDPAREAGWIADRDGVPLGAVFLVRADEETAKLRLLIVDPAARGIGIGTMLVRACTAFARAAGYRRITLWTHSVLEAARRLYAAEGYRLTSSAPLRAFGVALTEETWVLELDAAAQGR